MVDYSDINSAIKSNNVLSVYLIYKVKDDHLPGTDTIKTKRLPLNQNGYYKHLRKTQ